MASWWCAKQWSWMDARCTGGGAIIAQKRESTHSKWSKQLQAKFTLWFSFDYYLLIFWGWRQFNKSCFNELRTREGPNFKEPIPSWNLADTCRNMRARSEKGIAKTIEATRFIHEVAGLDLLSREWVWTVGYVLCWIPKILPRLSRDAQNSLGAIARIARLVERTWWLVCFRAGRSNRQERFAWGRMGGRILSRHQY